jgi:hypothetical protein
VKALNVTAGVRGTDLWGKSTPERTFVVLIEGRIEVGSPGNPTVTLDKPMDYYERRAGAVPGVQRMEPSVLRGLRARDRDGRGEGPVATGAGRWLVVAAALPDRRAAGVLNEALRSSGYPVRARDGERGQVEVVVQGLAGEAEARALAASLRQVDGRCDPAGPADALIGRNSARASAVCPMSSLIRVDSPL